MTCSLHHPGTLRWERRGYFLFLHKNSLGRLTADASSSFLKNLTNERISSAISYYLLISLYLNIYKHLLVTTLLSLIIKFHFKWYLHFFNSSHLYHKKFALVLFDENKTNNKPCRIKLQFARWCILTDAFPSD